MCRSRSRRRSHSAWAGETSNGALVVARPHVALAHVGQLDRAAILVEQPGRAGEGDELPRPPQRVLEPGREQLLDRELGDELVEPEALALVDGAQQAVRVAEAGGWDGTHRRTVSARRAPGPAPRPPLRTSSPRRPPWRSPRRPCSPSSARSRRACAAASCAASRRRLAGFADAALAGFGFGAFAGDAFAADETFEAVRLRRRGPRRRRLPRRALLRRGGLAAAAWPRRASQQACAATSPRRLGRRRASPRLLRARLRGRRARGARRARRRRPGLRAARAAGRRPGSRRRRGATSTSSSSRRRRLPAWTPARRPCGPARAPCPGCSWV